MLSGIFLIGVCVACYRLSGFGVDSFTGMNLGISGFIGISFGTWQLIMNLIILIAVFFTVPDCIGAGTIVNMVCVGYIADFLCLAASGFFPADTALSWRLSALFMGTLFAALGVALYMKADMGIAPYDSVALILVKLSNGRISFQAARVSSDVTVLIIGVLFCLASGKSPRLIIGIGTVINSLFNGPLIQFFRKWLDKKVTF